MTSDTSFKALIIDIVDRIVKIYRPKKVILFGSHAYGKGTEDSDIDLLIIKNTDKRPIDRWVEVKRILRDTSGTLPVSRFVYTEKEIEERIAIKDFLSKKSLKKGKFFMSEGFRKQAEEWFERGRHDIETAQFMR